MINSSRRKTTRLAAGRNEAAEHLTLTPPKGKTSDIEIVVHNSTGSRRRPTTTDPASPRRSTGNSRSSRSSEGYGESGRRRSRPEPAYEEFHHSDKLPPISDAARHEITGIVLIVAGLILFFGMLAQEGLVAQVGLFTRRLAGVGAFIIPPLIVVMGATFIWEGLTRRERFNQTRITGVIFMIVAFISIIHLLSGNSKDLAESGGGGGFFAYYVNDILSKIITGIGVFVLWIALLLVGLMLALSMSLKDMGRATQNGYRWVRGDPPLVAGEPMEAQHDSADFDDLDDFEATPRRGRNGRRPVLPPDEDDDDLLDDLLMNGAASKGRGRRASLVPEPPERQYTHTINLNKDGEPEDAETISPATPQPTSAEPPINNARALAAGQSAKGDKTKPAPQQNWTRDEPLAESPEVASDREWQVPSINILANFSEVEVNPQDLRKKARLIENTLASFGVDAVVREVNTGPTVTQFALEPGTGVKVARITSLNNDLALALAAPAIRIEAPVPGQSRVGIEVPNAKIATVGLREIMESEEFGKRAGRLKFALGQDVSGQSVVADLAKMPHLLIAGSTGSGKSVCLNSVVAAYLLQYRPTELQFIMIDPKLVELSTYNGIPHLRFPVVTQIEADPEKERDRNDHTPTVMSVLKWTIREMERRYKQLSLYGHRNIESFNKAAGSGHPLDKLPYLVLIVDELADLMMVAPEEAESAICRLAQKARAVGIHLILATQRPSVDVVTGLIKANFPSRITFAVTSQIDSRVILDMAGAEKLLGRGDMLYLAADAAKPMRVQGVYVSDEEIDTLVKHWRQQHNFLNGQKTDFVQPQIWPDDLQQIEAEGNEPDELFEQALEIVRQTRTASTSLLQRKLRVGYNRAARLIEEMVEAGVIGQSGNNREHQVLLDPEDLDNPSSLTAAANSFEPEPVAPPRVPVAPPPAARSPQVQPSGTAPAQPQTPNGAGKPALTFPAYDPNSPITPRQQRPPDPLPTLPMQPRPNNRPKSAANPDFDPDPPL